jgi:hypothetical protein
MANQEISQLSDLTPLQGDEYFPVIRPTGEETFENGRALTCKWLLNGTNSFSVQCDAFVSLNISHTTGQVLLTGSDTLPVLITNTAGDAVLQIKSNETGTSSIYLCDTEDDDVGFIQYRNFGNQMAFQVNNTEIMTLNTTFMNLLGDLNVNAVTVNGFLNLSLFQTSMTGDVNATITSVDTSAGATIQTLPDAATQSNGAIFIIKDRTGNAGSNPITINTDGGNIDGTTGTTGILLNTAYGSYSFYVDNGNYYTF